MGRSKPRTLRRLLPVLLLERYELRQRSGQFRTLYRSLQMLSQGQNQCNNLLITSELLANYSKNTLNLEFHLNLKRVFFPFFFRE